MRATYTSALLAFVASAAAQSFYEAPPTDGTTQTSIQGIHDNGEVTDAASLSACETTCTSRNVVGSDGTGPCVVAIFLGGTTQNCATFYAGDDSNANVITTNALPAGSVIALRYGLANTLTDAPTAECDPSQGDQGTYTADTTTTAATNDLKCSCGTGRVNYSNIQAGTASNLVCVAAAVSATTTSAAAPPTTSAAPPVITTTTTSSSSSTPVTTTVPAVTTTSTSTTAPATTTTMAANPGPQISAGKRRRIRQAAFAF